MKIPKQIWIIFDPLDGPHLFKSEQAAKKQLAIWQDEAETYIDSVWDMTNPVQYKRVDKNESSN